MFALALFNLGIARVVLFYFHSLSFLSWQKRIPLWFVLFNNVRAEKWESDDSPASGQWWIQSPRHSHRSFQPASERAGSRRARPGRPQHIIAKEPLTEARWAVPQIVMQTCSVLLAGTGLHQCFALVLGAQMCGTVWCPLQLLRRSSFAFGAWQWWTAAMFDRVCS